MARVPPFELSLEEQRAELAKLRVGMSVAVVRAKNPFNIGAIIRVAHSFLVREIILIGTEAYYQRASMGMHRYENIVECVDEEPCGRSTIRRMWSCSSAARTRAFPTACSAPALR
jgi:tRNA G18 (ribose-2'-O)-methylase SpoU